jgi:hypothetical protein
VTGVPRAASYPRKCHDIVPLLVPIVVTQDHGRRAGNGVPDEGRPSASEGRFGLFRRELEVDLNLHIFTVSAGLVGVCLTVIGIIRIAINANPGYTTFADDLLAITAFVFIVSCLLAYSSLRTARDSSTTRRIEAYADRLFIAGLAMMFVTCALVTWTLL